MTEIVLLIASILVGLLVGVYFCKRALRISELFCDLQKYIAALQLNVVGKQLELGTFNLKFTETCSVTFKELLLDKKMPQLTSAQKRLVEDFFGSLDCASSGQLLQNLQFYEKLIDAEFGIACESVKKSSIYIKLGLLLGAMVGIMFL